MKQIVSFCSFANAPKTDRDEWGVRGFPPFFFNTNSCPVAPQCHKW